MRTTFEHNGYAATAEYSEGDGVYHGRVEDLDGDMISFEGATLDEAAADFKDSVEDYLTLCRERGREPRKQHAAA